MDCISPRRDKCYPLKGASWELSGRMGVIKNQGNTFWRFMQEERKLSYLWNRIGGKHLIPCKIIKINPCEF